MQKQIFRAAVFNHIHPTCYYHVRMYELNEKTGKYHPTKIVYGHRGPGGNLGFTSRQQAQALADKYNAE